MPRLISSGGQTAAPYAPAEGEPNRHRFRVRRRQVVGQAVVALVEYPDCSRNYEGRKVLVYESYDAFDDLVTSNNLEPHFQPCSTSPIARFEPTGRGWDWACAFAETLRPRTAADFARTISVPADELEKST